MNLKDNRPLFTQMADAIAERDQARESVDHLRRMGAENKVGASSLMAAEWVLANCNRRIDRISAQADYSGEAA